MEECEYGPILPPSLERRISRVVPINDILKKNVIEPIEPEYKVRQDADNVVRIEPRSNIKSPFTTKGNWLTEFIKQQPKDRIIWSSKLHHSRNRFSKKSMYEQAEELMDIAASDFADCINKLSDDEQHKISDKMIKALFSIEIENDISHSLNVKMLPLPVVCQEISELKNCPELFIETRIAELLKKDEKLKSVKPKYHAFGRSLSPASRHRKRCEFFTPEPFRFPKEIRSGENLFHGIDRLKSTKALIEHLTNTNMPKPQYLCELNTSKKKQINDPTTEHPPL